MRNSFNIRPKSRFRSRYFNIAVRELYSFNKEAVMLKFFFLATGVLLLNATSSHSAETIGFRQIVIDQGAP